MREPTPHDVPPADRDPAAVAAWLDQSLVEPGPSHDLPPADADPTAAATLDELWPNPYSRLEAVDVPRLRLNALLSYLEGVHRVPSREGLAGVLIVLAQQLNEACVGSLRQVELVRDGSVRLHEWMNAVEGVLYPPTRHAGAADADADDGRKA